MRKFVSWGIILFSLFFCGCFKNSNPVSVEESALEARGSLAFNLVLPEKKSEFVSAIVNSPTDGAYAVFRVKICNFGNFSNPSSSIVKNVPVINNSATVTFENLPTTTIVGEIEIHGGHVETHTNFRGAIDLSAGENTINVAPKGSFLKEDVLANTIDEIIASSSLFIAAKPLLASRVGTIVDKIILNSDSAYNIAISTFAQEEKIAAADYSKYLSHIMAFSMPIEVIETGAITAIFAKNAPKVASILMANRFNQARFSFRASTQSSFDTLNGFSFVFTNYLSESDYDPIDPIGKQNVNIKYLTNTNLVQRAPDFNTERLVLSGSSEKDYGTFKVTVTNALYQCTNYDPNNSWTSSQKYSLTLEESGKVDFGAIILSYCRVGNLIIDGYSGKLISGTVKDNLVCDDFGLLAEHVISNNQFVSTYFAGGEQRSITTIIPDNNDEYRSFSWINPVSFNQESLSLKLNGRLIPNLQANNDRINNYYSSSLSVADIADTTYARVFRHACNYDPTIDQIYEVSKIVYPNDFANQINYCIGFVTKGVTYKEDIISFSENEYVCTPSMTLYKQSGDCEDQAILLAALMKKVGFEVALILFYGTSGGHAIVGLNLPPELEAQTNSGAVYFDYYGKRYYCLEATGYCGINDYRPYYIANGYSLAAVIPSDPTLPVLKGSVKALLREKW